MSMDYKEKIKQLANILEQMIENGAIGVVGAMHDIETGKVNFYNDVMYIKDNKNPKFTVTDLKH